MSRLSYEKGVDILINALTIIRKSIPDADLTIVGDGPERQVLMHLADRLGLSSVVHFVGTQTDTIPFLSAADVYVQPSRFEGWGIAVLEAAAASRPIVMTDVGCAGDVIENGKSGLVVRPGDAQALAAATIELLKDRALATRLAASAHAQAQKQPDVASITQRLRVSLETTAALGARDVDNGLPMFLTAFCVRLALLAVIVYFTGDKGLQLPDTLSYLPLAKSLLAGRGFTINGGGAYTYRTIGYPLFLATGLGMFHSLIAVSVVQAFISSFAPSLIMAIGRRLGLDAKTRRAAGWLTACEPHLVYYALPILVEGVFIIPFLGFVYAALRVIQERRLRWAAWAGLFLGITLLIKPLMQAFPAMLVLLLLLALCFRVKAVMAWTKAAIVTCLVAGVVIFPWLYHNHVELGSWSLSAQGEYAVAGYFMTSVISIRDQIPYQQADAQVKALLSSKYGNGMEGRDLSKEYMSEAMPVILHNPGVVAKLILTTVVSYWTSHNYAYVLNYYGLIPAIDHTMLPPTHYLVQGRFGEFFHEFWPIFSQPFYFIGALGRLIWGVAAVLMLIGLIVVIRKGTERASHIFVASLLIYFTGITLVDGLGIDGRLRYHVMPLIFLYAAFGWQAICSWRKARRTKTV